jgi:hypothetical protein
MPSVVMLSSTVFVNLTADGRIPMLALTINHESMIVLTTPTGEKIKIYVDRRTLVAMDIPSTIDVKRMKKEANHD